MRQRYYIQPASGLIRRGRINSRTHRLFSNFAPAWTEREYSAIFLWSFWRVHLYSHGRFWQEFCAAAAGRGKLKMFDCLLPCHAVTLRAWGRFTIDSSSWSSSAMSTINDIIFIFSFSETHVDWSLIQFKGSSTERRCRFQPEQQGTFHCSISNPSEGKTKYNFL